MSAAVIVEILIHILGRHIQSGQFRNLRNREWFSFFVTDNIIASSLTTVHMVIFLQQARTWPALMSRWTRVEGHMRHFHPLVGFASTVHSFVYVFAVGVFCKYQYGCFWKLSTPLNIPHVLNPFPSPPPLFSLISCPPIPSQTPSKPLLTHHSWSLKSSLSLVIGCSYIHVLSCNSILLKPSTICPYYIH